MIRSVYLNNMNPQEFAQSIKKKYPQYQNVDDVTLSQKIIEKYPQYQGKVMFEPAKPSLTAGQKVEQGVNKAGAFVNKLVTPFMQSFQKRGENITEAVTAKQSPISAGLQTTGEVAGAVGDMFGNVISPFVDKAADKISDIPAVQKFAQGEVGDNILRGAGELFNRIDSFSKEIEASDPEKAKNIKAIAEVLTLVLGEKPVQKGFEASVKTAGAGLKTAGEGVRTAASTVDDAARQATSGFLEGRARKAAGEVDRIVGMIAQGKSTDIPLVKKALSTIETDGIKTYNDLTKALDDKITGISTRLDEMLGAKGEATKLDDLTISRKVDGQEVRANYVDDAISQLETYYRTTNDVDNLARVRAIKAKSLDQGLTVKELNDVARMHGRDLNGYNANGELASGLSKKAAENTRQGVKNTARELFGNDAYRAVDSELSALIRTRDLAKNVSNAVNKLKQRVQKRGLGEKAGRLVFQVVDTFSGGALKGFVQSFIPRGQGLKVMNALDLEKYLQKNLNKLQKLIEKDIPEKEMIKGLEDILRGDNSKGNTRALNGGAAGLEVSEDENGNTRASVNPLKAVGGIALAGMAKRNPDGNNRRLTKKDGTFPGLSKNFDPIKVAKNMDDDDALVLDRFIQEPKNIEAYMEAEPLLRAMGIEDLSSKDQVRVVMDLLETFDDLPTK
jgi:hypothetical protein